MGIKMKRLPELPFGRLADENRKQQAGTGKAKIDAAVHDWAFSKFLRKIGSTITATDRAIERQQIEIHRRLNRMGVEAITITPIGDVFCVHRMYGGEIGYTDSKEYYSAG